MGELSNSSVLHMVWNCFLGLGKTASQPRKSSLARDHPHSSCVNGSETVTVSLPFTEPRFVIAKQSWAGVGCTQTGVCTANNHSSALLSHMWTPVSSKHCTCSVMPSKIRIHKAICVLYVGGWVYFYFDGALFLLWVALEKKPCSVRSSELICV